MNCRLLFSKCWDLSLCVSPSSFLLSITQASFGFGFRVFLVKYLVGHPTISFFLVFSFTWAEFLDLRRKNRGKGPLPSQASRATCILPSQCLKLNANLDHLVEAAFTRLFLCGVGVFLALLKLPMEGIQSVSPPQQVESFPPPQCETATESIWSPLDGRFS